MKERLVTIAESGLGPFGQMVAVGHHVFGADEPESSGGRDTGPDPFELVMAGLGACTSMTIRMYADRKGWPVGRIAVTVRHRRRIDAEGRETDLFERSLSIDGYLDADQSKRVLEIADKCPVGRMLLRNSEVVTSFGADAG